MLRRLAVLTLSLVALGVLAPLSAFADGFIVVHEYQVIPLPRPHPWPIPMPHPVYAPLAVSYHQVDVKIEDQVALTTVDQEFVNPSPLRLEGTYIFPLPKGSQIDRFTMDIDGKEVAAELLDAEKARAIYEEIVRKAKDPAILEYAGRDILKARIFPIEPNGRKRVRITYRQVLRDDGGMLGYVYPLNTERFSSQPIERIGIKVEVTGKTAIKNVYSPSHKVEVKRHDEKRVTLGYEEKGTKPDTDFHLYISRDPKDVGVSVLTYRPDPRQDGYFLLLASPGMPAEDKEAASKDMVFVLDTSGSMSQGKLDQARKALHFCIDNLNAADRFEIVRFSTEAEPLFGQLKAVGDESRKAAREFLNGLKPMGGTAIDEALQKALAMRQGGERPFTVLFLTDGQPTIGETNPDAIVARVEKANAAGTRVFCFGVGTDLNTHLLDRVTEVTRSSSEYVLPEEDIEIKVSGLYTRIQSPVMTEARLAFGEAVKASQVYPPQMPDLFRGDQVMVFGRYSGSGPVAMSLEGKVKGEARKLVLEATFPAEAKERPWVAHLWAARRVGYLLDEIRLRGESKELKDEVTSLARAFGIVTPYTAYLILEDERHQVASGAMPAPAMALREMAGDEDARERAKGWYGSFQKDSAGRRAVESRNDSAQLKEGWNAQQAGAPRGLEKGRDKGEGNYAQQVKRLGRKTFYQNGNAWTDADVGTLKEAKRIQVRFGSEEYFALARRAPEAAPWLSLGQNVQLALEDGIYEITE